MNFILFLLASIGMTHIIVDSAIFQPVRDILKRILPMRIAKLFECYQCTGTWCGFILGYFLLLTPGMDWFQKTIMVFVSGCAASFLATWGATYLNYLEAKTIIDLGDDLDASLSTDSEE